jgi:hypothetical protein
VRTLVGNCREVPYRASMPDVPEKPVSEILAEIDRLRGEAETAEKRFRDIQDRIVELRKDLARKQGQ